MLTLALAYWYGDHVGIDREADMVKLADVSLPAGQVRDGAVSRFTRREGQRPFARPWPARASRAMLAQ